MSRTHSQPDRATVVDTAAGTITAPADPVAAVIDLWFIDTFHNRGLTGPEYNRLLAAVADLKNRVAATR
jgi:hypothetical protein